MTQVDFYILPDEQPASLHRYACKLAELGWNKGKRVLIQTDNTEDSQQLDDLLWSLRADSFIPHAVATLEPGDDQQPILISHQKLNQQNFQQVINLSSRPCDISADVQGLEINEILNQQEQRKQVGREHYKTYRAMGYTLQHHTLEQADG